MEIIQELANQLGVAVENLLNAYAPYCLGDIIGVTIASFVVFVASLIVLILSLKAMLCNYNAFQNCDNPNVNKSKIRELFLEKDEKKREGEE